MSDAPDAAPRREPLGDVGQWLLWAVFGLATAGLIRALDAPGLGRVDLLLLAAGGGAILTALAWFFLLGARRSAAWALAFLVPYVNLIAAGYYARWYWREGARAPALLGLGGLALQLAASLRMLAPTSPPLV